MFFVFHMDERFRDRVGEKVNYDNEADPTVRFLKFLRNSPDPMMADNYVLSQKLGLTRSQVMSDYNDWMESGIESSNYFFGTPVSPHEQFMRLIKYHPETYEILWAPAGLLDACKLIRKRLLAIQKKRAKQPVGPELDVYLWRDLDKDGNRYCMLCALLGMTPWEFFDDSGKIRDEDVEAWRAAGSNKEAFLAAQSGREISVEPTPMETTPTEPDPLPDRVEESRARILDFQKLKGHQHPGRPPSRPLDDE